MKGCLERGELAQLRPGEVQLPGQALRVPWQRRRRLERLAIHLRGVTSTVVALLGSQSHLRMPGALLLPSLSPLHPMSCFTAMQLPAYICKSGA